MGTKKPAVLPAGLICELSYTLGGWVTLSLGLGSTASSLSVSRG